MRILKESAFGSIRTIAGEMLNLEASRLEFLNGDLIKDAVKGYPKVTVDNRVYTHKASEGYIFVSSVTDAGQLEQRLLTEIQDLEKSIRVQDPAHLKEYHTIEHGYHTNVKVRSQLTNTAGNGSRRGNVKRQFRQWDQRDTTNTKRCRFTWWIVPISQFVYEITNESIADSLSRYVYSIFYDAEDICKLDHNAVTFNFTRDLLRSSENLVKESVTLTKHGSPVAFELSSYWRDYATAAVLRNIPREKLYKAKLGQVQLKPVKLSQMATETTTDVCSKCRSLLYGDNYVLYGSVSNPDLNTGVAICPLCLHTDDSEAPIEQKYFKILVVTFPFTIDNMINKQSTFSDERKNILREALKGVRVVTNPGTQVFVEIGKEYIGVTDTDQYLYSKMCKEPEFIGKKVCKIVNTHLLL